MSNKIIKIGVTIAILVGIVVFAMVYLMKSDTKVSTDVSPTPTPTMAMKEADGTIDASLTLSSSGRSVVLAVTGLTDEYTGIEYDMQYKSNEGLKGTFSGAKPIPLTSTESFTRDIELGTCSTGGKCRYDSNVSSFLLTVKLHTKEGSVVFLKKEFEEL